MPVWWFRQFFLPLRPFFFFFLRRALSLFCCYFAIYSKRLTTIFSFCLCIKFKCCFRYYGQNGCWRWKFIVFEHIHVVLRWKKHWECSRATRNHHFHQKILPTQKFIESQNDIRQTFSLECPMAAHHIVSVKGGQQQQFSTKFWYCAEYLVNVYVAFNCNATSQMADLANAIIPWRVRSMLLRWAQSGEKVASSNKPYA